MKHFSAVIFILAVFNPSTTSYYLPQTVDKFPVRSPVGYEINGHRGTGNAVDYNFVPESAVTGIAVQYGSTFVGQGADYVQKSVTTLVNFIWCR